MKFCIDCKETKHLSEFPLKRGRVDGHDTYCKVCNRRRCTISRAKRKDLVTAYNIAYRQKNLQAEKIRISQWKKENPSKHCALNAKRNAIKLRATPSWANEFFIQEAYHLAELRTRTLGFSWHVDHVVPLQGKRVCGLHVENNLQVIPATENLRKYNKHA